MSDETEPGFASALREALDKHFPEDKKQEEPEEDVPAEKQPKDLKAAAEKTREVFRERRRDKELAAEKKRQKVEPNP